MRLIDADALMPLFIKKANTMKDRHGVKLGEEWLLNYNDIKDVIDNAPTVDTTCPNCDSGYAQGYSDGYLKGKEERPQDEQKCKTCNYYHPYFEQFSNEPRGDGYCVIARMTPEGLTTINCNDEFGCSDYQEKQGAKNVF